MDPAFERALRRIPPQLRERPGTRFTVIINGNKKPEGTKWSEPNGANYGINDAPLAGYLAEGHNYGVLCGHSGITVPDLDDLAAFEELGILQKIPDAMKGRTGRGGMHVFLDCPELDHQIGLYHPTLKDEDGEPLHLGEIQSKGQQVVGPGSIHPNGNRYEIINNAPILKISKADLLKIFDGLILTGIEDPAEEPRRAESRRRSSGGHGLGDHIPIDQVAWPKDIKERHGSEVIGTHPLHDSKGGKNFSVNTDKNCWHCFRHGSGGGPLEWLAVEAGLIGCQDAKTGCLDDKETFKKVLKIARDRGFNIPEPVRAAPKEQPKGPTVLTALQKLLDNEDKIIGECAWNWRRFKPRTLHTIKTGYLSPEGEEKCHKFLKQFKKALEELGIDYDDLYPLLLKPRDNKEGFSDEIKARALEGLKNGDPGQYVADSCGRMVLGAEAAFKKLVSCVSVQNIHQSAGLHPKLTGNSSGGKTWTVYSFAHHLPKEAVIKGSMSAKAGFYHDNGNRVFRILDDYQAGNEDLDTTIKQTTSEFHSPYTHRTVIKQVAAKLEIGSEQTWGITSVNNDQDIQVINRGIPINVDDSVELTQKVNKRTVQRYGLGEEANPVDETVLVCRAMFQILRDEGYINVRVPFWERIEWLDTSNRRNPSIFMDLVIAHTAMFRHQREKDADGYYLATEEDFTAAKALFTDRDGEELVKRLGRREREVLDMMIARPEGITRGDIVDALGIAPQQVTQIFNGQKGNSGLLQKVAIKETQVSEMMRINKEHSRTIHKTVYFLKDYDRFAGFDGVVRLNDSKRSGNKEESKEESKSTDSRKEEESKESKNKNKIDSREREDHTSSSGDVESTLSLAEEKITFPTFLKAADSEKVTFLNTSSILSSGVEESNEDLIPVRFRTDYKTDVESIMRDFREGDEIEVARWRAEAWQKRGIVDIVEASA